MAAEKPRIEFEELPEDPTQVPRADRLVTICGARGGTRDRNYVCTRPQGHVGFHVAHGFNAYIDHWT